ncbi:MAG: hypothetical protein WD404_00415 [Solirubrobacterales bacterium]
MKAIAVLPVKRFASAKRRLAAGIDEERREALVEAMLGDVRAAIGEARSSERTIVVSAEPRAAALARPAGAEVLADPAGHVGQPEAGEAGGAAGMPSDVALPAGTPPDRMNLSNGHRAAARAGIAVAMGAGAECVVLLPGDCPLLEPRELDRLLTGVPSSYVAIVPDRHGSGTNALVLAPPEAIAPAFGEGSCARHVAAARAAGIPFAVEQLPSLALDLDTPADIVALTTRVATGRGGSPGRGRRTAKALGI